ncbi:Vacuolar protein sorting-associated protein 13D [Geodia barretti]|uniref:Vacuolar protein sorting-associated protein 13D n=1 Tax=Geodia barretti TaxID=519541 RepID=A0AA35T6T3_GEOBA|nr:Vacuolar protein sorting-associated protein 13D [Geodia barretti]
MLERLAAYFLNTYVAEYVGNVVTDQLTIGWRGDVELEKLPLKKNALHKHQLPFDIVSGFIGKLKLQIPVRYIKSQPWVVQIDQVYVILGPSHPDKVITYKPNTKKLTLHYPHNNVYSMMEMRRRGEGRRRSRPSWPDWSSSGRRSRERERGGGWWFLSPFSLSLPSNIISNLQVIINDVHVRYEDSSPGVSPFSLGVLVSSISSSQLMRTGYDIFVSLLHGNRKEFRSECDKDYKLMDVVDFSVYWDSTMVGDLEGDALVLALQEKKAAMETQQDPMSASMMAGHAPSVDVIIKPTGGQVKLIRNRSRDPLKSSEGPRVSLEVHLEEIPVEVREEQWGSLVRSGEESVRRWSGRRWRKWKPLAPVSKDPRGWWMFAIMSVVERVRERNRRCSPEFLLQRANQNIAYVAIYTQHLALGSVSEEGRKMMEEVEREQTFEELAVLRRLVMTHIKTERDLAEAAQARIEKESGNQREPGVMQRWFTGWMSGYQGQQEQPPREEEEEELLQELGYESSPSDSTHRDSLFLRLSFTLSRGSLSLLTSSPLTLPFLGPSPLVSLSFSSLCSSLEIRPRVRGATFELSLGGLSLNDEVDDDSLFPALMRPKGSELPMTCGEEEEEEEGGGGGMDEADGVPLQSGMESPLFRLRASLERGERSSHLHVHSRPLDVVYSRFTTDKLFRFLQNPWVGERGGAHLGAELRSHTTAGIRHRLEELLEGEKKASQYQLSVRLDISAPRIIIPEDVRNRNTQMVILDLGHVTFGSVSDWSEEQEKSLEQAVLLDNTPTTETEDDDDEEFATPLSSPPGEAESTDGGSSAPSLSRPVGGAEVAAAMESMSSLPSAVVRDTNR